MAISVNNFVSGDTASKLRVSIKNASDQSPFDLTGSTVQLRWKSTVTDTLLSKTMTVLTPATNGQAEYQFLTAELEKGSMAFEIQVTDGTGKILRSLDLITQLVREALA